MDAALAHQLPQATVTTVIHSFDGNLKSLRPLPELATAFDLTGFSFEIARGTLRSMEVGLSLDATSSRLEGVALVGAIDDASLDPDEVLRRLALAMEADGIPFTLRLLDADGVARVTYESDC
jgi:hypothetical protein